MYKQFTDSLQKYLYDSQNLVKLLKAANANYKKEIATDGEIILTQDTQIKELARKNKGLKISKWLYLGAGAGIVYLVTR